MPGLSVASVIGASIGIAGVEQEQHCFLVSNTRPYKCGSMWCYFSVEQAWYSSPCYQLHLDQERLQLQVVDVASLIRMLVLYSIGCKTGLLINEEQNWHQIQVLQACLYWTLFMWYYEAQAWYGMSVMLDLDYEPTLQYYMSYIPYKVSSLAQYGATIDPRLYSGRHFHQD